MRPSTIIGAVLAVGVWLIAASNGYALETIWLPAVVIGAAWPRSSQMHCAERQRRSST